MENSKLLAIILTLLLAMIFGAGAYVGVQNHELAECVRWQNDARKYAGFFLVGWQKEQCNHYGIEINAPVK